MLIPTATVAFASSLFLVLSLNDGVDARSSYADLIPNGRRVPHPGPQGGVWAGVGHFNAAGGTLPNNQFGLDFLAAGLMWTTELCRMDSDKDGRSNGEELGDPDCLWQAGGDPPSSPATSHPGVADTPRTLLPDACEDYEDPADAEKITISFTSPNNLNATRTHYRCEQFQVDSPNALKAWQQIKTQVVVDNRDVLHHMWIYQCINGDSTDGNRVGSGPYECNGMEGNCQIVAGWAVGPEEWCEPPNTGQYLDFASAPVFKVEAHYDNAKGVPQTDQSGMQLTLTSSPPRPLNGGLAVVGMDYWDRQFMLPAGQSAAQLSNICPSTATQLLPHPVYVYSWNPHMHLYGKQLVTEHYRCGVKIGEIGRIADFEFDNQQSYRLEPPIKILPGDALVTTCTYDTSNVANAILGGEETTEEMCDNYLTYYPWAGNESAPNVFTGCVSYLEGLNPKYAGFDDGGLPFARFDLGGDLLVEDWNPDPAQNLAPCCATSSCEQDFQNAELNEPCAVDDDCRDGLVCSGSLCADSSGGGDSSSDNPSSAAPWFGGLFSHVFFILQFIFQFLTRQ